jgi:hypothetical protein
MASRYRGRSGVAGPPDLAHTGWVSSWNNISYAYGPLMAMGGMAVLILLLRWAFGHGESVVERPPRAGTEDQYGLLVPVAAPPSYVEGELIRRSLEDAGLRATLAQTNDGPRVMVWPDDEQRARRMLSSR